MKEHDFEPVWGLPGRPPEGEEILWQGAPDWRVLARHGFHLRFAAAYLGGLWLLLAGDTLARGAGQASLLNLVAMLGLAIAALCLIAGFAWLIGRTTAYTVTNRRVVLRIGIALSKTINLPFALIDGANLRLEAGDVALQLRRSQRVAWLVMWPHVRPWRLTCTEPMLRAVPDAAGVAQILARALAASAAQPALAIRLRAGSAAGGADEAVAA